jgi:hypothetical protein
MFSELICACVATVRRIKKNEKVVVSQMLGLKYFPFIINFFIFIFQRSDFKVNLIIELDNKWLFYSFIHKKSPSTP